MPTITPSSAASARLDGKPVMIIGQQKGRDTKERVRRNYGMPKPEGYRKALRLMRMAERFQLPLITFIDTSGAYPGVGAEERGQSEAIARNLFEMSTLRIPDHQRRDRRGRLGRRARDRRGRSVADAPVQHLFGDFSGRLRRHSVAQRGQEGAAAEAMGVTARAICRSSAWSTKSSRSRWAARIATPDDVRAVEGCAAAASHRAREAAAGGAAGAAAGQDCGFGIFSETAE